MLKLTVKQIFSCSFANLRLPSIIHNWRNYGCRGKVFYRSMRFAQMGNQPAGAKQDSQRQSRHPNWKPTQTSRIILYTLPPDVHAQTEAERWLHGCRQLCCSAGASPLASSGYSCSSSGMTSEISCIDSLGLRVTSLTPCVARPVSRMVFTLMRTD